MHSMRIIALFFLVILPVSAKDSPSLPKPGQVDNPGMIRFIKPDPGALPGIVVDDTGAKMVGKWKHSVHTPPFVGVSYIHDMKEAKGEKSATFVPDLPSTGRYEVRMSHNSAPPPSPAREAPGNQSWKSNFLAIIGISLQLILSTFQEAITARKLLLAVGF
jgi:hypothetical protein